jgi:predicted transcriptional regulator
MKIKDKSQNNDMCNGDTQLPIDIENQKREMCNDIHNSEDNLNNIIKSSVVYVQQLLLLSSNTNPSSSELCNIDTHLMVKFLPKWIEIIQKSDYLKIVYYLIINGICHARGIAKVYGGDSQNISKQLEILKKVGIIEDIESDDEDVKKLFSLRRVFNLSKWHFDKAVFYKLSKCANLFFFNVDFKNFLEPFMIKQADLWTKRLRQTHSELDKEEYKIDKILNSWYGDYSTVRYLNYNHAENKQWINGRIESLANKKGLVVKKSGEEILEDFDNRYKVDKMEKNNIDKLNADETKYTMN